MKIEKVIFVLLASTFFVSCNSSKSVCGNFLGNWVKIDQYHFIISKNGETYIMDGFIDGYGWDRGKWILICEQGQLTLTGMPIVGNLPVAFLDNGNTIMLMGHNYIKQ